MSKIQLDRIAAILIIILSSIMSYFIGVIGVDSSRMGLGGLIPMVILPALILAVLILFLVVDFIVPKIRTWSTFISILLLIALGIWIRLESI